MNKSKIKINSSCCKFLVLLSDTVSVSQFKSRAVFKNKLLPRQITQMHHYEELDLKKVISSKRYQALYKRVKLSWKHRWLSLPSRFVLDFFSCCKGASNGIGASKNRRQKAQLTVFSSAQFCF